MSTYKEFRTMTRRKKAKRAAKRFFSFLLVIGGILLLSYVIVKIIEPKQQTPINGDFQYVPDDSLSTDAVDKPSGDITSWDETKVGPISQNINEWELITPDYRMISLPENGLVDVTYFDNATFVGDSISQGLSIYNIFETSTICAYKGVSPKAMYDGSLVRALNGSDVNPMDEIAVSNPAKIYILLGTNGLTWMSDELLISEYGNFLNALGDRMAVGTKIYVQAMPPVTAEKAADERFSNERIRNLNNQIAALAYQRGVYFVDLQECLADADGNLAAEYAQPDGLHLTIPGYNAWKQYLLTHTAHAADNPYLMGSPLYNG